MKNTQNIKHYLAGSVAVITFGVYLSSLQNSFIAEWDDGEYVLNNLHIHSFNLAFLRWAFLDFYASNWHPLTWISHALDYAIWGLNPLGYHLTNNILHAANTFLVVYLIVRLQCILKETDQGSRVTSLLSERAMLITAGVTGLLFGLHPVHVESVAWISERKDLLCALFFLLSIIMYTRYVKLVDEDMAQKKWTRFFFKEYQLTLGFFILSLLSKPMAVSLPIVLLILDWYPFRRIQTLKTFQKVFVEKFPLVALSLISSILTVLAQKTGGAVVSMENVPLSERLSVAARSLITYLWKLAVPRDFIPYYPYPKNISLGSPEYVLAVALVIGITVCCVLVARRHKLWLTAWGYYVATLLPVIGIVQVGSQSMADRYTYLPSLAPFLIIAAGTSWCYDTMINRRRWGFRAIMLFFGAGMLICVGMSYLTIRQIQIWENGLSVWSYVIEREPRQVSIAYTNLGSVYQKMGQYDKAMENFDNALYLDQDDYLAYLNRGVIFDKLGQLDKAIENYNKAVILHPNDYAVYFNRGLTYGKIGNLPGAIEDFKGVIALNPNEYRAYNNIGILYSTAGMYDKAIESFSRCVAINPDYAIAYNNRGLNYSFINQYDRAIEDFTATIRLDPNNDSAYLNRANMHLRTGGKAQAETDYRRACELGNGDSCSALQGVLSTSRPR